MVYAINILTNILEKNFKTEANKKRLRFGNRLKEAKIN